MYHITPYTYQKAKRLGVTVKPSHLPQKKLDVIKNGKIVASVGAKGYSDYPHFIQTEGKAYADKRRELYHKRHTKNGIGEFYAKELLW